MITVQELINILSELENKNLPVYVYNTENSEIHEISLVDTDISDRVDLNITIPEKRVRDLPMDYSEYNQRGGRHINRMIFLEREEIGAETLEFLERNRVIDTVDYGNTELTSDMFKQMVADFNEYDKTMSNGDEITLKQIREELGLDIADGLITGKLDFVQIIYD